MKPTNSTLHKHIKKLVDDLLWFSPAGDDKKIVDDFTKAFESLFNSHLSKKLKASVEREVKKKDFCSDCNTDHVYHEWAKKQAKDLKQ